MNHQNSQHSPTIQWSTIPGNQNQLQQMAQQHPPSQHQIAPYRFSSSAASPSLSQVSCSSMHLQPSTNPPSPLTICPLFTRHHTQCTHSPHHPPTTEHEIPTSHPWQTVKKRKRTHTPTETAIRGHLSPFYSPNQFEKLSHLSVDDIQTYASDPNATTNSEQVTQPRVHKPPSIYVYSVTNYCDVLKYLTETLEEEQYYCKALLNETVKINANTLESYRKLIKRLQDDKIVHHTYQIREEKPIG